MSLAFDRKEVCVWKLKNIPEHIKRCDVFEYDNGTCLLDFDITYSGSNHRGMFLSLRACRKYVTEHVIGEKSLWIKFDDIDTKAKETI